MIIRTPIYQQLNDELRNLIHSGEFNLHDRFLTEREIADRFGVSRATANKALSSLVGEGIVEFRKGVGTFVRSAVLDYDLRSLVSFTDKAVAAGMSPSTKVLSMELRRGEAVPDRIALSLRLQNGDEVYYIERLRLADERPVIYEKRHMVARLCPNLSELDLSGSLYALWVGRYGLEINGAEETIRAVQISEEQAGVLGLPPGSACLLVTSTGYIAGNIPLWYEETLYRGDSYEFQNQLGPIKSGRPASGAFISK